MQPLNSSVASRLLAFVGAAALLIASVDAGDAAWPFPPAPKQTVVAQNDDQAARLNNVESQMRALTGQIEQLQHQIQVLQEQLKRAQDDNEFRFGQLEKGGKAAAAKPAPTQPPTAQATPPAAPPLPAPPAAAANPAAPAQGDAIAQQLGAPPQPLGTLTVTAQGQPAGTVAQPLDLSTLAGDSANGSGPAPPAPQSQAAPAPQPQAVPAPTAQAPLQAPAAGAEAASVAPTGNPRSDYDQAYTLINTGQYALAEKAFRQFLASYPTDEQAPDAQYWLGEALYDHGDYAGAAQEFKAGYTKYPNSKRAPDTLLKLGLSLAGLGYRDEACKMYALLQKKYPQMSNGLKARLKAEQASAAC